MARNDGTNRTVVRNQCVGEKEISRIEGHNEREKQTYTNPDIDLSRSGMNVHYKTPTSSYAEMFSGMEESGQVSTRGLKDDADHYGELVFDVNTAYFEAHGGYEFAKQFYAEAYRAAVDIVGGEQYILSAVMHADERNRSLSETLGRDVFHYHLHVVYIPVVEKQIKWTKRCKDPALVGTVKETIMQVIASKKWQSYAELDEHGNPKRNTQGKLILKKSYAILQDHFFEHMAAAGYTDIQRGERGSTEEHLSTLEFKAMKEEERLAQAEARQAEAEQDAAEAQRIARQAVENAEAADAKAREAEERKEKIEGEAEKVQKKLDGLLKTKQDVAKAIQPIEKAEDILPKPGLFVSAASYWKDIALPVMRKMLHWCKEAVAKLTVERAAHKETKQDLMRARKELDRTQETVASYRDKAVKFDLLEKILGRERIQQLFAEHEARHQKHHKTKDEWSL